MIKFLGEIVLGGRIDTPACERILAQMQHFYPGRQIIMSEILERRQWWSREHTRLRFYEVEWTAPPERPPDRPRPQVHVKHLNFPMSPKDWAGLELVLNEYLAQGWRIGHQQVMPTGRARMRDNEGGITHEMEMAFYVQLWIEGPAGPAPEEPQRQDNTTGNAAPPGGTAEAGA